MQNIENVPENIRGVKRTLNFEDDDDYAVSRNQALITKKFKQEMIDNNESSVSGNFTIENDKENSFDMNNNSQMLMEDEQEVTKFHMSTPKSSSVKKMVKNNLFYKFMI